MVKINYKFADGHMEEIEVTEKFAQEYEQMERAEHRREMRDKKRARRTVSIEYLSENGIEIADDSPNPLEQFIENEESAQSLISLADFLTARQKQIMELYFVVGYKKAEIARLLKIDERAVRKHITSATKKILKNFS